VCDTIGCWEHPSMGFMSSDGYRWVCRHHIPREEKKTSKWERK
jgi:hypothetical protein